MKQADNSNATTLADTAFSKGRKRASKFQSRIAKYQKRWKFVLVFLAIVIAVVVYLLAQKSVSRSVAAIDPERSSAVRILEIEVLDGTGTASMRIAQQMTNIIRALGYDVVEMKKNNTGIIDRTYILDRSGNLEAARKLASNLGISQDKVFQKINSNLYLDVTVMVGKDYSQLKVFQSSSERNVP